jgi:transmembrane sensor
VQPPVALQRLLASASSSEASGRHVTSRRLRGFPWAVPLLTAAAGVAATLVAMSLAPGRATEAARTDSLGAAEFASDTSETATATLEDGSVVRLAPRSRLRVTPVAGRREVWLDGEGFFAVSRDPARPFRVRTRAGSVEVLGTRFDLRVDGPTLRLVVTEGTVALATGHSRVLVRAGEMASADDGGSVRVTAVADPTALLDWMKDALIFQDTPLREVARELEHRYRIRVLLPDSTVAERRVTAWFTHQDVSQVLAAVCRAVEAHCTLANGVASVEP